MARAIIDELARGGVGLAVISPGSRSTALTLAADEHPGIETVVALDERSGGFHALGRAKAHGRPAAAICTSGTAAANYYPAVVEADMSLTPLVALTADRPAESRGVGANQTIDQVDLYGGRVRFFADIAAPEAGASLNGEWRRVASRAVSAALGSGVRPGPVHLNVAFREPTVPAPDDGRAVSRPYEHGVEGRADGARWTTDVIAGPPEAAVDGLSASRGLVIAGDGDYDRERLTAEARLLGWPVLATAQSGLRGGDVIGSYHHILAGGVPERLRPEAVAAVGAIGPSRRLEGLVAAAEHRVSIDRWGRRLDPGRNATAVIHGDPAQVLASADGSPSEEWSALWRASDAAVDEATKTAVAGGRHWTGAGAVRALNLVGWDRLVAASSLPIREVDAHLRRPGQVIANRGASGIDGLVSTALGAAAPGEATAALSGDLSLLHDSNGFLTDVSRDLVVVVLDNDGGGLFDSLPQARHAPSYERLFVAPHGRDLARFAGFHGVEFAEVGDPGELAEEANLRLGRGGAHLLRAAVDRGRDIEARRSLDAAALHALSAS